MPLDVRPRIAFDATPLEVRQPSGVSRYTADLLHALIARQQWQIFLASSRELPPHVFEGTAGRLGATFPNRWLWMQSVLPVSLARARPTLCHFTNYLAPIFCPVPYVLTIYDLSLFLYPEKNFPFLRHPVVLAFLDSIFKSIFLIF